MVVWRLDFIREMPIGARLGVATAAGSLIVALLMAALSVVGIEWSRTVIFSILAIGVRHRRRRGRLRKTTGNGQRAQRRNAVALIGTAFCWLLTLYGTLTARHSCGDLQFTWGPKAIRWFRAGGLDPDVLHTWPQLTVDYPPLQTLLLALLQHRRRGSSPGGRPCSRRRCSSSRCSPSSAPGRATTSARSSSRRRSPGPYTLAYPAGCAEPPLLLFEAIAIAALTFVDNPRAQTFLAALGLAGAVFTKLEGATFAVAVFLTILLVQRKPKRAFIVIAPAALLFAAWMTFVFKNDLLYMYGGAKMPIYWSTHPRRAEDAREGREVQPLVASVPRADRADRHRQRPARARAALDRPPHHRRDGLLLRPLSRPRVVDRELLAARHPDSASRAPHRRHRGARTAIC